MSMSLSARKVRALGVAFSAVALVGATACSGSADFEPGDTINLTLGAGHPAGGSITYTNHAQDFFVPELKRRVSEETDYELDINEQYGGSTTGLDEVLESTQAGVVDIGLVPYPFEPANLPMLNISYYVPFGSPDVAPTLAAANYMVEENPEILDNLESQWNQKKLAFASVGDYGLATTFPVSSMDDVSDRKLSGAGTNLDWVAAAGAVPVQGNLNEWYTGIQTGVYDGAVIFLDAYAGFGLQEVAPHFTEVGFGSVLVGGIHINMDTYNGLPEEVRVIIDEVAQEYEDTMQNAVVEDQKKARTVLEEAGITPAEFPESE